ncbi:MAG: hypothetical protein K2G55_06990 [Lachnospiraceae bacterium]|nr:hypothetical protein [Lachnospiraceae bacterium]
MKEVTIQELVKDLQGKVIRVESADIYGVNLNFSKARIEYDEDGNELSFVAGNYNTPDGIGGVGIRIDDVVEVIRLEDDGSYTIEFNQYMADINIKESDM